MKIQLLSDLHFEFHRDGGMSFIDGLSDEADVVVLAGDIATHTILYDGLSDFCDKYKHVVYVPGNHEYWNTDRGTINAILEKLSRKRDNFHWLHRSVVEIEGQRFVGTTLWFRYPGEGFEAARGKNDWSDFIKIKAFDKWIGPENKKNTKFLEQETRKGDIVVTHYLPHKLSIDPRFAGDPANCYFLCEMEDIIIQSKPAYWFHGHTHATCNYSLGETQVICNPFGYLNYSENHQFNENLIVNV